MANPTVGQVRINPLLTDASVRFQNKKLIADLIAPRVRVKDANGKFFTYDKDNLRLVEAVWPSGQEANRTKFGLTQTTYGPILRRGLMDVVDDLVDSQASEALNLKMDTSLNLTDQLSVAREDDLATVLANESLSTDNEDTLSGSNQWSDYVNSNPFNDIQVIRDGVVGNALIEPNVAWCGWPVWSKLKNHPLVLSKLQPTQLPIVTADLVASLMGFEKLHIGMARKRTSNYSAATAVDAYVWGKYFYMAYVTNSPGLREVNGVYTLEQAPGWQVDTEYDWDLAGEKVRVSYAWQHKVMAAEALGRIVNAVA